MSAIRQRFLVGLLLILTTVGVFGHACWNGFTNVDDFRYITENKKVLEGLTGTTIQWAFTTFYASNWHPLTWLSLQLDAELYRLNPWGFHLTNVLWHAANVFILFRVLEYLTGALWRSAFVAALFALHPFHVESVAWVSERKDVLSTFFGLLAIGAYAQYARRGRMRPKKGEDSRFSFPVGPYLASLIAFALSLLAKPMFVTLPAVLLLLDYWPLGRLFAGTPHRAANAKTSVKFTGAGSPSMTRILLEKVPFLVLAIGSSWMTLHAQRQGQAIVTLDSLPIATRVNNALLSYVTYLGKTIWPFTVSESQFTTALAPYYPLYVDDLGGWKPIAAAAVLAAVSIAVLVGGRRRRYLPVGWLWYLGTLVPVVGLVQVGNQAMADRYTYVPLIGLFLIMAWGIEDLVTAGLVRPTTAAWAGGLLLALCAAVSWWQIGYWKDSISLWNHTLRVTRNNFFALNDLGQALHTQGANQRRMDLFEQAIACYEKALAMKPKLLDARYNLGLARYQLGQFTKAEQEFRTCIKQDPGYIPAYQQLAAALARQGKREEAEEYERKARALMRGQ